MTRINEDERQQMAQLVSTQLWQRAKREVLEQVPVEVMGSSRTAENVALDLAYKEGMHEAFRRLEALGAPAAALAAPPAPRYITKTRASK